MLLLLIAGIACLAVSAFQLTRPRVIAERERRRAIERVRATSDAIAVPSPERRSLGAALAAPLARLHRKLWARQTDHDIATALARAGASRRFNAESFMALRVGVTGFGLFAGFTFAHGAGRILLALLFGAAGILLPGFLLSKAASRRADQIDTELPHFVDQLALVIEAGMSFDAAVTYLADVNEGPLAEEMKRVLTELRVGESRKTAIRNFAERVGSDEAMAFANAVLASDQLGSPLSGILRAQASDLRHRRQMHAEERAQKAPVKMLLPMAIFILPVMFVLILAPAFLGSHGLL
ncbi:MAG TPA: type II secretion system F family protein [Gaiellaceae bacterium]|jgi:tight adherence protein C|nr:type II secretion system F family protein [Gaiellaceae bacterium]